MYLVKKEIAPKVVEQEFEINIEAVSLVGQKFEFNADKYKLGVVIDGSLELTDNSKIKKLVKEDIFIINSGSVYGLRPLSIDNLALVLNIDEEYIKKKFTDRFDKHCLNLEVLQERKEEILLDIYRIIQMYYYGDEIGTKGFLKEVDRVIEKLTVFKDENNKFLNTWIRTEVMEKMKQIFTSPEIQLKLEDISKQYNVKNSFMSKAFKSILGYSFVDACHMAKIDKAIELLIKTDKGILEIAFDSGFSSSKTFHENFKKYIGETPNLFRKKNFLSQNRYVYSCFDKIEKSHTFKNITESERTSYYKKLKKAYEISADEEFLKIEGKDYVEKSMFAASSIGENWISCIQEIQKKVGFGKVQVELKISKDNFLIRHGVSTWNPINESTLSTDIQFVDQMNIRPHVVFRVEENDYDEYLLSTHKIIGKFLDILCNSVRISRIKFWSFELDLYSFWKKEITPEIENKCKTLYTMFCDIIIKKIGDEKNIGFHLGEGGVEYLKTPEFTSFIEKNIFSVYKPRFVSINISDKDIYSENVLPDDFIRYIDEMKNEIDTFIEKYKEENKLNIEVYISVLRILDYYSMVPNKYHEMVSALGNIWGLMWYLRNGIPVASVEYFNKRYKSREEFEENLEVCCRKLSMFNKHSIKTLDFYVLQFVFGLEKNFLRLEDGIIATTNGVDYKLILFQDMDENIRYIFDKELCLKKYPGKEIKLILKGLEGRYKLKISTLRTEKGTMYYESSRLGELEDFDLNDIEYLKNKVIPKMEIEKINVNGVFERKFNLDLFEIKCIEIIKLG